MKKIVIGIAALACAASMFAVDFAARNYMTGSIMGGGKDSFYLWQLNEQNQKDADALVLSADMGNAGAKTQLWYTYNGKDGNDAANLKVRNTSIWFKPIDQIKITVGDSSVKLFGETLHYWKDPVGNQIGQGWNGYSGYGTIEGSGISVDVTPMEGLLITAGIAAGTKQHFIDFVKDVDPTVKAWGAGVKYDLNGLAGIPLAVGVEFRSAGSKAEHVLGIGATYGARYAEGFYAMVEARLRMNENDSGKLNGITINNHFRFATGPFAAQLRAPVTIRLPESLPNDAQKYADPSWLTFDAEVTYALDGFTPYLLIGTDPVGNGKAYALNDKIGDYFGLEIKPGVRFNVGAASLDIAALIDINPKYGADTNSISWSVPFELVLVF